MRAHLLWLLLLILLGASAQALRCHECSGPRDCYQPTSCRNTTHYCLTTWATPPGKETFVIKACAYTCPGVTETSPNTRESCCNWDLCNGSVTGQASWGLLALSVWCIYLNR